MTTRPQFDGPMPTLESMGIIEDTVSIDVQKRFEAKLKKLINILHQIDPPIEGVRGAYAIRYNPKIYPDGALIRGPDGAGCFLLEEMFDNLNTAADWDAFARKTADWLKHEAADVMEAQLANKRYQFLQSLTAEANRQGDVEKVKSLAKMMYQPNDQGNYKQKIPLN